MPMPRLPVKGSRQMTTPVPLPDGVDGMSYGFGLIITPVHRLPCFSHGGGLNGWSSELLQFPEQKCTVVALANALPPVSGFEPYERFEAKSHSGAAEMVSQHSPL